MCLEATRSKTSCGSTLVFGIMSSGLKNLRVFPVLGQFKCLAVNWVFEGFSLRFKNYTPGPSEVVIGTPVGVQAPAMQNRSSTPILTMTRVPSPINYCLPRAGLCSESIPAGPRKRPEANTVSPTRKTHAPEIRAR